MQVAAGICQGNLKLWHCNWTCTSRCLAYKHTKNHVFFFLEKKKKKAGFFVHYHFVFFFFLLPSVIRPPCRGRFLSGARGAFSPVRPGSPTGSSAGWKPTATCLCSVWRGGAGGPLDTRCRSSSRATQSQSHTALLVLLRPGTGWELGLTLPQHTCPGLQVLQHYNRNNVVQ